MPDLVTALLGTGTVPKSGLSVLSAFRNSAFAVVTYSFLCYNKVITTSPAAALARRLEVLWTAGVQPLFFSSPLFGRSGFIVRYKTTV